MKKRISTFWVAVIILAAALILGQAISFLFAPDSWRAFLSRVPVILSMIAFWGPIVAIVAGLFVWSMLRLLGFKSLEEIRIESVEQNNPTPAVIFIGTLIASLLFLMLVIRP
jgi:hypothetical protein